MIFILRNKDVKIALFELSSGSSYNELHIVKLLSRYTPYFLKSDISFISWISNRMSPISRRNVSELFKLSRIDNLLDYCLISKAVSLNDTFWIDKYDSDLLWKDVSPYTNSFSTVLENISWGMFDSNKIHKYESPEFSTDGNSKKCWQRINNEIVLLKSEGYFGELGYSCAYSEYFATQLCDFLRLKSYVRYSLRKKKDELASVCPLFTSEEYGFVSIGDMFSTLDCGTLDLDLERFRGLGASQQVFDIYQEMLLLDSLSFNIDRHEGNYGFIIHNDTQRLVTISPIFDNDHSLFYNIGLVDRDSKDISDDLKGLKPKTYQGSFVEQGYRCVRFSKDLQIKLYNVYKFFSFTNSKDFPCNQERVNMMSTIVQRQAGKILMMCKDNDTLLI